MLPVDTHTIIWRYRQVHHRRVPETAREIRQRHCMMRHHSIAQHTGVRVIRSNEHASPLSPLRPSQTRSAWLRASPVVKHGEETTRHRRKSGKKRAETSRNDSYRLSQGRSVDWRNGSSRYREASFLPTGDWEKAIRADEKRAMEQSGIHVIAQAVAVI